MRHLKRYSQLFVSQQELPQEQKDWLDKCTVGTWSVNPQTGLVDVEGGFDCQRQGLTDFKGLRFGHVSGYFDCYKNSLTSLEGAPQIVDEFFVCSHNELKSLEGAPQSVVGSFDCSYNNLTSLEGAPQRVGGYFDCNNNSLTSLEGAPQSVDNSFNCGNNKLKSLEGLPDGFRVGLDFNCENTKLKSLEGLPAGFSVGGSFRCRGNELESLDGLPDGFKVREFLCSDNKISQLVIDRMVQRMGDKKISLGQAAAECWRDTRDMPQKDKFYLAKSAFNSTVIEDPEIVRSEDAIQIYLDAFLQSSSNEREEYKIKLSKRGDIDQEMIGGLDSMVRILNRHR